MSGAKGRSGGARVGSGGPAVSPTAVRVTVTMDAATLDYAGQIGEGNVSLGIRRALDIAAARLRLKEPAPLMLDEILLPVPPSVKRQNIIDSLPGHHLIGGIAKDPPA